MIPRETSANTERQLGVFGAGALVAGNIIGAGIFMLPVTFAAFGSISLISWGIGTAGFMALGLVFGALVRVRPDAENLVAHVREGTGLFLGYQATALYWISCITGNVGIALAAAGYLGVFVSALKTPWNAGLTAIVILAVMTAVNLLGPRLIGRLSALTVIVGLVPIVVVGVLGWFWFDPALWAGAWNVSHQSATAAIGGSLVQVAGGFLGVESAVIAARVVRDPERNLGRATIGGVAVSALVYVAACTVLFGLLPADQLAKSGAPFADAMARTVGPIAGAALAACALVKTLGALGGWILVTTETSESAAEEGMLPKIFGSGGAPSPASRGLFINLVLAMAVAFFTISPSLAKQYAAIVSISVVANFAIYSLACIALLRFARDIRDRLVALGTLLFCVSVVAYSGLDTLRLAGIIIVATTALFGAMLGTAAVGRLLGQSA